MKVTRLQDAEPRPRHVAIGTFDGVHLGHREVIHGADTVVTFDPHPRGVLRPGTEPKLLTTLARKTELIAECGAEELVIIPFDLAFAARSAEDFLEHVLIERLSATHVTVGENFSFGHRAGGNVAMLEADGRFACRVVPLLEVGGEIVSSSHIRGLLAGGAVHWADELLGSPFVVDGIVQRGEGQGTALGHPTANIVADPHLATPGHGVYATRVRVGDGWYAAATTVGVRPQASAGRWEVIEAHLLDWEGDVVGQPLRVEFLRRLRGERRFAGDAELAAQLAQDAADARAAVGPIAAPGC